MPGSLFFLVRRAKMKPSEHNGGKCTMEQHLIDSLSKLSTSHLLILLVGYSIGKVTTYLIQAKKAAYRGKVVRLEAEIERLKKQLNGGKECQHEKAD